jgi:hypothetical protein
MPWTRTLWGQTTTLRCGLLTSVGQGIRVGLIILWGLLAARAGYPWGDTGHELICEIAFQELTPQARTQVTQLLQEDPDFTLFSKACTWPDHPRQRAGEHYVNLPRTATGLGDTPCPVDTPCLLTAIAGDLAALSQAEAPAPDRLAALKFLGHWVGDVHQPLHVSFKDDRGGNEIRAQGSCRDNLHAVWDTCLIERTLGQDIRDLAAERRMRVTGAERAAWTRTGAKDWANESFAITTSAAGRYCVQTARGCWYEADHEPLAPDEPQKVVTVDEAYLDANRPTVTQRLTQAGIRLGHLLNQALSGE